MHWAIAGICVSSPAPDIIFMRFQIYQQIRYEHLLLRYDEIYTMSDKTPYIIGRHCTQYKYYRALGFSLNQFFLFPHLPPEYMQNCLHYTEELRHAPTS